MTRETNGSRAPEPRSDPSLLGRRERGGDIAEGGFFYQDNVVLSYIPRWLAQDPFTEMTRESISDAEAKFFVPGRGYRREAVQVKNYTPKPAQFWSEIEEFQRLDARSPGTYGWFTLVLEGLPAALRPLASALRRVRGPYGFYEGTAIAETSYRDYESVMLRAGRDEEQAKFLFERVLIETGLSTNESHWRGVFQNELVSNLPEFADFGARKLNEVYEGLLSLIRERRNEPIGRRELERKLLEPIEPKQRPAERPVRLHTSGGPGDGMPAGAVRLDWAEFFADSSRSYPSPAAWNERLVVELEDVREWMCEHGQRRHIELSGRRRLSASVAIGAVFPAVGGFSVDVLYRGEFWSTDSHANPQTPRYEVRKDKLTDLFPGERLVVGVGIGRNLAQSVVPEVEAAVPGLGLAGKPRLYLLGDVAVVSAEQANALVGSIKSILLDALRQTGATVIDLFFAGPAPVALFLGHRLNARVEVQCYEHPSTSVYVPTCRLRA